MKGRTKKAWKVFSRMAKVKGKKLSDFISQEEFQKQFSLKDAEGDVQSFFRYTAQLMDFSKGVFGRVTLCLVVSYTGLQILGYTGSTSFLPQFISNWTVSSYFSIFVAFVTQIPWILIMAIVAEYGGGSYTLVFPPFVD